jgi:integrase
MTTIHPGIRKHSSRDGYEIRVRYKDPITGESKRASGYAKTLPEAKRKQREMLNRIDQNQRPLDDTVTFGDWLIIWQEQLLPLQNLKPNTEDLYRNLARKHIQFSPLAKIRLSSITSMHLGTFFKDLGDRSGQSLLRNSYTVLTHIFRSAATNGFLRQNPLEHIKRPKQAKQEVRFLSEDEMSSLMRELSVSRYWSVAQLILQTGMRRGEALGLSWDDVDFERQQLHVRFTLDAKGRRGTPKTPRSIRTLDLNPKAVAVLKSIRKAQTESRLRLGPVYVGCEWNPVFTTEDGKASQPRVLLRAIQNAADKCGLNGVENSDRVGVHTLRHYVATRLLSNGVDMMVVSRILGHESIKTTVDIYGHLQDNLRKQALSSLA